MIAAVRASPELVALGKDGRGQERFTSRDMLASEQRLERATEALAERSRHGVGGLERGAALTRAAQRGLVLSAEQRDAFEHVTQARNLGIVIGYAGTGKSAMLGVARDAWENAGYRVTGLALSGIAAENLESGSGIASRTIASMEHQWGQGRELLSSQDVLVVDEAGMIGTRQMERIVREAEQRGAKLVLVGDPEQLQAIEAGAAFRSIAERHGGVEIMEVRRQREDWQRDATRQLATGRTSEAIHAYDEAGHVHVAETREHARKELIDRWDRARRDAPDQTCMILTHTRDEVAELNGLARDRLRAHHELGIECKIETSRGERLFAQGDRIMFLRNERSLGVKNGSLGVVESINPTRMAVLMDDGRSVAFDVKDYSDIDHGYAATIHKSQGVTVDRVHVLATPGLDRHATYVALSRHRNQVDLHYGRDDFADERKLVRTLSRERNKDMVSDHVRASQPERSSVEKPRSPFAGLKLRTSGVEVAPPARTPLADLRVSPSPAPATPTAEPNLGAAVQRVARAMSDIERMGRGKNPLPHQQVALDKARHALDAVRPDAAHDLASAFAGDPALVGEAAKGRTTAAVRAMQLETEIRTDPSLRADRFVTAWQQLRAQRDRLTGWQNETARTAVEHRMSAMGKELTRDPQLESLLRNRRVELGLRPAGGTSLSQDLANYLGRSRSIGISF